jgi:hypothetical protein
LNSLHAGMPGSELVCVENRATGLLSDLGLNCRFKHDLF